MLRMDWFDKKSKAHVDTPTQEVAVGADTGSCFSCGHCCDVFGSMTQLDSDIAL